MHVPELQPDPRPVRLGWSSHGDFDLPGTAAAVGDLAASDVGAMLHWAVSIGASVPPPGAGWTIDRWELLATVAVHDLTVARVLEPHLDALAILAEAGHRPDPASSWGVWAAEGPGARLEARDDGTDRWLLDGRKPWCSLAASVTHALVTAWVGPEERRLFAIDLASPGIRHEDGNWAPHGLTRVVTQPVTMSEVPGQPVGPAGWYLRRDGFWWGGLGVAAVWYGGAVGLARRLVAQLATRAESRPADQIALMHLGEVDAGLAAARAALADAAGQVDGGLATGPAARVLAARVRHVVADVAEDVLRSVSHALGPGPLSQEPEHAARVSDLALYLRQHHAERDAAELGRLVLERDGAAAAW